jgi:phosphohistidine phosphatase
MIIERTYSAKNMKLIIIRHGEAETFRVEDKLRSLTAFGDQQATLAGEWLSKYLGKNVSVDLALVSPYVRAKQTFIQINQQVDVLQKQISNDVIPNGDPQIAHDYIRTLLLQDAKINTVVVVSHMPFVSYFLEEVHVDKQSILFDTSSIAIVDYNPKTSAGSLEIVYHPA